MGWLLSWEEGRWDGDVTPGGKFTGVCERLCVAQHKFSFSSIWIERIKK